MLQRAAGNAYSWWWASHIRTKQSKWLDNNLQDMEVKVQDILKLIEEDGDSFAQKAEMYYRKRPELINFVEEFYRAYRSLAERYDHISGELHKANNTIATVFPDQLQLTMEDEDDFDSPKVTATHSNKVHKALTKDSGKKLINKDMTCPPPPVMQRPTRTSPKVDKEKAQEEIDQLQKEILVLQTEKEFVKSCYESNLTKYWDIEKRITEMQHKVCLLQDDFSINIVIEDDEARALMAATALKSCEDTLRNLHEEQKRSIEEARMESERIKSAKEKLNVLKGEQSPSTFHEPPKEPIDQGTNATDLIEEASGLKQEKLELKSVCAKIKQCIETPSDISIEVLAEKIDELVDKVISLEATVSSQVAHIRKLRLETDELYKHLQILEEEKSSLSDDSKSLGDKLRHVEKELCRLQHLDESFQDENHKIQIHFTETCGNFNDLSEKFQSTDDVGDIDTLGSNQAETVQNFNDLPEILKPAERTDDATVLGSNQAEVVHNLYSLSEILQSTSEAGNVTAPPNQGIVHSFNGISEKLPFVDEAGDITVVGSNQIDVEHNLKGHSEESRPNDEVTIFRSMQVETVHNASSPGKPSNQDKTHFDELNNSLDDWAKEVFHAIPQPDFFLNDDQHMHTDWEANLVPNGPSKMPSEENQEDDTKTIYASDNINQQLAKPQGDNTGDTNFIPSKFTECLAVPEQQVLVGKTIHIPNAENQQEDQAKVRYVQATETESDPDDERGMQTVEQGDSPNWQKLFLDGLDDREKVLLAEYTSILRNYKDMKRKYSDAENKHQEYLFETMSKIRDLKNSVAMKDEEIRSLRQKLHFLEANPSDILDVSLLESKHLQIPLRTECIQKKEFSLFSSFKMLENHESSQILKGENTQSQPTGVVNGSYEENSAESPLAIKLQVPDEPETTSAIEDKFRRDIDELLEQNLEFWLRFSSSFQQIQKLQTSFQELQGEISKLKDTKKQEGGSVSSTTSSGELSAKPEATPLHKLLRDLQNDMSIWLDQNAQLKVELQCRFSSLCNIKDEITKVLTENPAPENEGAQLTAYQAAKFHGEVLNMQQENNKVADELEAGTDHIKGLLADVEQTMAKLNQNSEISASAKPHTPLYNFRHLSSRTRIPLRSFLFGVKSKQKKPSIFSCMNPALQKQYSDMTAAIPP